MSDDFDEAQRAFQDQQRQGIGSTDTPKILGWSKYGTALTVYNRIVNGEEPRRPSLPAWLGQRMQGLVGEMYTERTGQRIVAVKHDKQFRFGPGFPFIVCHLDFRGYRKPKLIVEAKTRAYMTDWGEEGSTKIPLDVWAQCQHEMLVTRATRCDVAVLFGHHTFRVYQIPRDEEFLDKLVRRLEGFWNTNVMVQVPPEPTGHPLDAAAVKARYPENTEQIRSATPEQTLVVNRLRVAQQNTAAAAYAEAEAEVKVRDLIGAADGITGTFGTVTWKRSKDSTETDWKAAALQLQKVGDWLLANGKFSDDPIDNALVAQAADELATAISSRQTPKPGVRKIHYRWSEGEGE